MSITIKSNTLHNQIRLDINAKIILKKVPIQMPVQILVNTLLSSIG